MVNNAPLPYANEALPLRELAHIHLSATKAYEAPLLFIDEKPYITFHTKFMGMNASSGGKVDVLVKNRASAVNVHLKLSELINYFIPLPGPGLIFVQPFPA